MEEWGWNPQSVEAYGALAAAVVALVAVVLAAWAARAEHRLTKRLVAIEQRRDEPQLRILHNVYREHQPLGEPQFLFTVVNTGGAVGGPVSIAITDANGADVSFMHQDPVLIDPGTRRSIAAHVIAEKAEGIAGPDDDRRGGSDLPPDATKGQWEAARLGGGHLVRAYDAMTGEQVWFPRAPPAPKTGRRWYGAKRPDPPRPEPFTIV